MCLETFSCYQTQAREKAFTCFSLDQVLLKNYCSPLSLMLQSCYAFCRLNLFLRQSGSNALVDVIFFLIGVRCNMEVPQSALEHKLKATVIGSWRARHLMMLPRNQALLRLANSRRSDVAACAITQKCCRGRRAR